MDNNEIIEIESDKPIENNNNNSLKESTNKKNSKKEKKKIKLSKKNRLIIIISGIIILLVIVFLLVYFLVLKKDNNSKIEDEPVIVKKDNYRFENGKLIFINKSNKEVGSYLCENNDALKCKLMVFDYSLDKFDRVTSIYEDGKELEIETQVYNDRFVFISDGEKNFIYDINDNKNILDVHLVKYYNTEKELFVIENEDNKYGILQFNEDEIDYLIRPSYDYLAIINTKNVYSLAKDKDESYIVDSSGKKISKNIICNVASANDKYIICNNNNVYNLYSYDYEELISDYDYISLHDNIISVVKSNRLYLYDNELNKLNEEGLRLNNKDYVKKYVYNNQNKLLDTKKSYDVTVNNGVATVSIGNETKNININEGIVSSKLDYINYFDGKIYFYADAEKVDLIGTYSCSNKNNISDSKSSLSNCNVLRVKDMYTGIYNNDYVFIKDTFDKDEDKFILYSLKEKKAKGTYSNITILSNNELNSNIKSIYTSSSFFILKTEAGQNKGNYGIIEINSTKVAGKIDFKYKSINKENNYYLLQNIDDNYVIYDNNLNRKSNELNYIKLYDKYYVGIINNKLNVYSYENAIGILENDLPISDTNYNIDFTDGFIIKIGDQTYNYDIEGKLRSDINNEE